MSSLAEKLAREARFLIAETCRSMMDGKIDLVSGSRIIQKVYLNIPPSERKVILTIIGFESETDTYPMGEARLRHDPETLDRLDKEIQDYSKQSREAVLSASAAFVSAFSA